MNKKLGMMVSPKWAYVLLIWMFTSTINIANAEPQWIDVRTTAEKIDNGIDGDMQMSHDKILAGNMSLFPDKNADIRLYCRSGRRSGLVTQMLLSQGYTNVTNVGSIENARKVREIE